MKKTKIGLYLGINSIGGVLVENNKKVTALAKFDLASLEEEAKIENLNEDVKWEALINKTLRELGGVESKDVYVSLADRDFIFRSIEMPLMRKKEIESSLVYEISKYVPFKIDELRWDYDYTAFSKEKKLSISFIGMKDDKFKRTQALLTRLGLNPLIIEPSSLSLVRVAKTQKSIAASQNFAVLDFMESEAYLTFFYKNLPVFNRYFSVPRKDESINLDKFIEPIHLSYQYFRREFRDYALDKFIIINNSPDEELQKLLKEDLQTDVEMFYPTNFINVGTSYVENLKALGVANIEQSPYKFKPVLKKTSEEEISSKVVEVPLNKEIISFVVILGIILCATVFFMKFKKFSEIKSQIEQEEAAIVLPADSSWDSIRLNMDKLRRKVEDFKKVQTGAHKIYPFLDRIGKTEITPRGVWLDSLDVFYTETGYEGSISGRVFLGDPYKERQAIDSFVSNLRNDEVIKSIFSIIDFKSSATVVEKEFEVTSFIIELNK